MLKRTPAEKPRTLAQKIKDAELAAQLDAIKRKAAFDRELEERERDRVRLAESLKDKAEKKTINLTASRAWLNRAVPYAPLFLVNLAAITGQIGWAYQNLSIGTVGSWQRVIAAVLFGVTVETIALFLQYYANRALLNRDSAGSLYLSAFVVAALVAAVNFSHWSNPTAKEFFGTPNATAIVFALCSFVSPWLWRIHNRAEFREALRAAGEIDARAVKLSLARKILYPIRSFRVIRLAAWAGETNPTKAVEMYETRRVARATVKAAERAARNAAKRNPLGNGQIPEEPSQAVVPPPVEQPVERLLNGRRDMTRHTKWADGLATYSASVESGAPLNTRQLAAALGQKNKVLASAIINHYKDERNGHVNAGSASVPQTA